MPVYLFITLSISMKNIVLPFLLLILVAGNGKAQTELGELVAKTTDNFTLKIPKSFREVQASWADAPIYFLRVATPFCPLHTITNP